MASGPKGSRSRAMAPSFTPFIPVCISIQHFAKSKGYPKVIVGSQSPVSYEMRFVKLYSCKCLPINCSHSCVTSSKSDFHFKARVKVSTHDMRDRGSIIEGVLRYHPVTNTHQTCPRLDEAAAAAAAAFTPAAAALLMDGEDDDFADQEVR